MPVESHVAEQKFEIGDKATVTTHDNDKDEQHVDEQHVSHALPASHGGLANPVCPSPSGDFLNQPGWSIQPPEPRRNGVLEVEGVGRNREPLQPSQIGVQHPSRDLADGRCELRPATGRHSDYPSARCSAAEPGCKGNPHIEDDRVLDVEPHLGQTVDVEPHLGQTCVGPRANSSHPHGDNKNAREI